MPRLPVSLTTHIMHVHLNKNISEYLNVKETKIKQAFQHDFSLTHEQTGKVGCHSFELITNHTFLLHLYRLLIYLIYYMYLPSIL